MRRGAFLASEAEVLVHEQAPKEVIQAKYLEAAQAEESHLCATGESKPRTRGILAVSTAALYYKAGDFTNAIRVAVEFGDPSQQLGEYYIGKLLEIISAAKSEGTA